MLSSNIIKGVKNGYPLGIQVSFHKALDNILSGAHKGHTIATITYYRQFADLIVFVYLVGKQGSEIHTGVVITD